MFKKSFFNCFVYPILFTTGPISIYFNTNKYLEVIDFYKTQVLTRLSQCPAYG